MFKECTAARKRRNLIPGLLKTRLKSFRVNDKGAERKQAMALKVIALLCNPMEFGASVDRKQDFHGCILIESSAKRAWNWVEMEAPENIK